MGLALAVLGVWMVVRGLGRRYGIALAAASLAWVAIALLVVIPHFNAPGAVRQPLGLLADGGGIAHTLAPARGRPCSSSSGYDRLSYLGRAPHPAARSCSLAAPLLAAGALPELLINVLADWFPQYSIEFQYVAVIVPFLVAAAILGLARLRRARRPPGPWRACSPTTGAVAVVWVGRRAPGGVGRRARCRGGTTCPPWAPTSAWSSPRDRALAGAGAGRGPDPGRRARVGGNLPGAHLSERERIYTFPVDRRRAVGDRRRAPPVRWPTASAAVRTRSAWRSFGPAPTCGW